MRRKNDDESSLSHTRWNCQYHIVFTQKIEERQYIENCDVI